MTNLYYARYLFRTAEQIILKLNRHLQSMYKNKNILALIPARGGSKGLPNKNIRLLLGKPLIAWTLEQALKSKYLDNMFVSTDSEKIASVAKEYGIKVPFLRPVELAADDSPTSDAVIHALTTFEQVGEVYDYIVLLEPTSPLRKSRDIDEAIKLLVGNENAECLITVGEIQLEHPMFAKKVDSDGFIVPYIQNIESVYQRQQTDKAYFPYGVIYMSNVSSYKEHLTFYVKKTIPYFIERWQNFEIDDEIDFIIVEKLMAMKMEVVNG